MNNKPIILVTGATGAQGGSVAKALLASGQFTVRILTRNATGEKVQALLAAGAEIATGDMSDKTTLVNAMKNCYGVFGVTNFWEHYEKEYALGANLIDAVHASGIKHFVLHTLPDYNALSNGKYPTPHCDIKASLKCYTKSLDIPASFVEVAFYYENFFSFFLLQQDRDGSFSFGFPQGDTPLAMTSVRDTGPIVSAIFEHPIEYIGRTVGVVGANDNCHQYAATMSKVLHRNIRYNYIPHNTYAALGFPGAEELANMFEVQRLHTPTRQLDLIESYGLNPGMQTFEAWLIEHKQWFDTYFKQVEADALYA